MVNEGKLVQWLLDMNFRSRGRSLEIERALKIEIKGLNACKFQVLNAFFFSCA